MSNEITTAKEQITEEQKLRAAYALNMCNVSVSQIVQYNDIVILEQEYDTILNNLNLEQIPKDDALLNILVELLNTITFFKTQNIKKDQIEKKYQQQMKNAIWSAVPSFGMLLPTGKVDPVSLGISIVTMLGTSLMNYRKAKAGATTEKQDKETELRITAIEQFDALKRELFTTAWRLADRYQFPDRYRLTEKQIIQYNNILMDADELRKYARLEAIKDKFEAYPQFWYQMGHSAAYISQNSAYELDKNTRDFYHLQAKKWFEKFFALNKFNILREDHFAASAALEYSDLLLINSGATDETKAEIVKRLDETIEMAGNACDILQMYAVTYLKCGATHQAQRLLKYLINEEYNALANGKLLSRQYSYEYLLADSKRKNEILKDYSVLSLRISQRYLFPMPQDNCDNEGLVQRYFTQQKSILQKEYHRAIRDFIKKHNEAFNNKVEACKPDNKKRSCILQELNEMLHSLENLYLFASYTKKELLFVPTIQGKIYELLSDDKLNKKAVSFQVFTEAFFKKLLNLLDNHIDRMASEQDIGAMERAYDDLVEFCKKLSLPEPVSEKASLRIEKSIASPEPFAYFNEHKMFHTSNSEKIDKKREAMARVVRNYSESLLKMGANDTRELKKDSDDSILKYLTSQGLVHWSSEVLLVLENCSKTDCDFWITYDGFYIVDRNHVGVKHSFSDAKISQSEPDVLDLGWPDTYENPDVYMMSLANLLMKLHNRDIQAEVK